MNGPDGITGIFSIPGNADKCSAKHGLDQNALHTCAHGDEGAQLYYDSVWAYSDLISAGKVSKYDAPDIPVVHINGVETKGLDAYFGLSKKICDAYEKGGGTAPKGCGCSTTLDEAEVARIVAEARRQRFQQLVRFVGAGAIVTGDMF